MKLFLSYLRLLRPFNLLMIAFTLYMVRFFFIVPVFNFFNFPLQVKEPVFAFFALSFIFIASGGYVINDYYDIAIDRVNKPGKLIIGNKVSSHSAVTTYWALNICGILTGLWSCCKAGTPFLSLLFIVYAVGLWYYSYKLKSSFLFGNILIAVFLGLVPLASACIEVEAGYKNPEFPDMVMDSLQRGVLIIAGFAFLATFIREIVKDMEDIEGDRMAGCRTVSIVWGIKKTKKATQLLLVLMIGSLGILQYYAWISGWYPTIYYVLLLIQVPCLIILWKIQKASVPKQFHEVSIWLKIVMLTGICYLFVFAYEANIALQFIKKLEHLL